jgi:hypothetical protein
MTTRLAGIFLRKSYIYPNSKFKISNHDRPSSGPVGRHQPYRFHEKVLAEKAFADKTSGC